MDRILSDHPSPSIEVNLARAVNAGDRRPLLDATGHLGVIARAWARGNPTVTQACFRRFSDFDSPVFGAFMRWMQANEMSWLAPPGLGPAWQGFIAEIPLRGRGGPELLATEVLAGEIVELERRAQWAEWQKAVDRGRVEFPPDPRLAIAEARGLRVRSRRTLWRYLQDACARFPGHFTLAQMYAFEIVWAYSEGALSLGQAQRLRRPLDALLDIDPDDYHLRITRATLEDFGDAGHTPTALDLERATAASNRWRAKLLSEVESVPYP